MTMSYNQVDISDNAIRITLMDYLRENQRILLLAEPSRGAGAALHWHDTVKQAGISVDDLANEVYQRIIDSDLVRCKVVSVFDSTVMNAYKAYIPLRNKLAILEEILALVQAGVLTSVKLVPQREGINYDFSFDFNTDHLMLTDYGVRFLAEDPITPHFTEPYLERLSQMAEPDDTLQGYLSEGLVCLRNHLGRAAAILLRVATEHILNELIESTENSIASIKSGGELQNFKGRIRKAGIRIEQRAETVFKQLESSEGLIPDGSYFRNMLRRRLRPAFHSIRDLGGKAAHLSSTIQLEEVRDHYSLYASTVYPITVKIIKHQRAL